MSIQTKTEIKMHDRILVPSTIFFARRYKQQAYQYHYSEKRRHMGENNTSFLRQKHNMLRKIYDINYISATIGLR